VGGREGGEREDEKHSEHQKGRLKTHRRCSCDEVVKRPPDPNDASTSLGFFSFFRSRIEDMLKATLREKEAA